MNTNLQVINASAGSGKTTLLVKKYLYLILQKNNPFVFRGILAITFTNKAAQEMKQRVTEALTLIAEENYEHEQVLKDLKKELNLTHIEFTERGKLVLEAILHNYSDLAISTIDAFVYRLIKTFSKDLNLPANFEVNLNQDDVLKDCIDILVEKASTNAKIAEYLTDYIKNNLEEESSWKIEKQLLKFSQILVNSESKPQLEKLTKIKFEQILVIQKACKKIVEDYFNDLNEKAKHILEFLNQNNIQVNDISGKSSSFAVALQKIINDQNILPNSIIKASTAEKLYSPSASKEIKALLEELKNDIQAKLIDLLNFFEVRDDDFNVASTLLKNIYQTGLLGELQQILQNQKREKNFLLISDFNALVSEALTQEDAPFIYLRTGEKFNHIFIDEFQDTSTTQWSNMLPLVENSLSDGNSVFLVGDVKQSIYRWRGSESEQLANFPNPPKSLPKHLQTEKHLQLKNFFNGLEILDTNYRSVENIVSFNNQVFEILSKKINPNFNSFFEGYIQKPNKKGKLGYLEFNILPEDNYHETQLEELTKVVARKIELNSKPKDILILTRGNDVVAEITAFLTDKNIPVISSEGLLLKNSPKVCLLMALLNYQYQKGQNTQVNATLWYWVQKNNLEISFDLSDLESNHLQLIFPNQKIEKLATKSVFELLETFAFCLGFYENEDAFISAFFNTAIEYFSKHSDGYNAFADWWNDNKNKLAVETPGEANAVSVMTIHKAKGLQFDCVILPFFNFKTFGGRYTNWVELDEEKFGISNPYLPISSSNAKALNHIEEYEAEKAKNFLDALNLLYVALTRPKKELFIFTKNSKRDGSSVSYINNLLNYAIEQIDGPKAINPEKYIWGEEFEYQKDKTPELNLKTSINYTPWREKIKISTSKARFKNRAMAKGERFHEIMAHIINIESLEKISSKFNLTAAEKDKIQWVVNHPDLKPSFAPEVNVIAEIPILTPEGKKYIPDRFTTNGNETFLIDYKTGEFQKKYETQLNQYAETLQKMGFKNITKQLVFTETEDVYLVN